MKYIILIQFLLFAAQGLATIPNSEVLQSYGDDNMQVHESSDQIYIFFEGRIEEDSDEKLKDLLTNIRNQDQKQVTLVLGNSPGGNFEASLEMASMLQQYTRGELTTYLPPNAKCNSACITLFVAGKERVAHDKSTLGFHSCQSGEEGWIATRAYREFMVDNGISSDWLDRNKELFESAEITEKSSNSILQGNFVNYNLRVDENFLSENIIAAIENPNTEGVDRNNRKYRLGENREVNIKRRPEKSRRGSN